MGRLLGAKVRPGSRPSVGAAMAITAVVTMAAVGISGGAQASTHKKASHKTETNEEPGACKPTPEQASIGIRALQTELMVAGLKCSAEKWNAFTAQFRTTIKKDADRMQSVFRKAYGKGGSTEMNSFVTQLANDASQRSNGSSEEDYCKQEDVLFQKVLALTGEELEKFSASRKLEVPTPVALCKPEPDAAETTQASAAPTGAVQPGVSTESVTAAKPTLVVNTTAGQATPAH